MTSIHILTVVLIGYSLSASANELRVNMDETATHNNCDRVYNLNHTHEVRVVSNGRAPNGYCGVTIFTSPEEYMKYTCDGMCVVFRSASLSTCDVKVKFTGHKFNMHGDEIKTYDCRHGSKKPFCMAANSMRVEVIESYLYAYSLDKRSYDFDLDISPRCTRDKRLKQVYTNQREHKAREDQNYWEGIAVGLSLACVFLVILFIMYCYYKHKAVTDQPDTTTGGKKDKGNLFATFRAKLPIGRRCSPSKTSEASYRKTDLEEPTAATSGTKAKTVPRPSPYSPPPRDTEENTKLVTSGSSGYELGSGTPAKPSDSGNDWSSDNTGSGAASDAPTVVVNSGSQDLGQLTESA